MSSSVDDRVRILVDHSGYGLVNIGDIAMLQACIRRLRALWPASEIAVFTESPDRLAIVCPDTVAVSSTILGRRWASILPLSAQLAAEQIWKILVPHLDRSRGRTPTVTPADGIRQQDAVRWADVVVSSGGGFVNDVFWWHGAGVLSILDMAQRLRKPTAMFGQGIGPITRPMLRQSVTRTMRRLDVVGLREGLESLRLLRQCGIDPERIQVTGDDALLLATPTARPDTGDAIGLNVRVASYSQVAGGVGSQVVSVVQRMAAARNLPIFALPVEHNKQVSDLAAIRAAAADNQGSQRSHVLTDVRTPGELAQRTAGCRVVVTGSYHAAVFGLAAGVPAVCVSNSSYYDVKFNGLAELFPGGCQIVRPGTDFEERLAAAISAGLDADDSLRDRIHSAACGQVALSERLYRRFKALATRYADMPTPDGEPAFKEPQ